MHPFPKALTIAGSDSGGGAGIQADLKTFMAFGVYGASVVTALTAQNTREVAGVSRPDPEFVERQIEAVMSDIGADAAKTGMLVDRDIIEAVARGLDAWPIEKLVVDPVMIAKAGTALLKSDAVEALRRCILPRALLATPNLPEVEAIVGESVKTEADMKRAGEAVARLGARAVLIKGGHRPDADRCDDLLFDGERWTTFEGPRLASRNTHGAGCTLSAAIAALLARGEALGEAVARAKRYLTRAIETAPDLGGGAGPLNHGWAIRDLPE